MSDLSTKTVMIVDNGLFVSFARMLGRTFKKVYYYSPWQSSFPQSRQVRVGTGFDEIERTNFPLKKADRVDLWIFADLYQADLQVFLEDHGARVWGGRWGEEMELYRWEFKQYLKRIGLPVQPVEKVVGMVALREYLKAHKDVFVKTSLVRGDFESFENKRFELTEPRLDEIEHSLGPLKTDYEFVVENCIPAACEIGYDGYTIDGKYPSHAMQAFEIKDVGMMGRALPYGELAQPVRDVNQALVKAFNGHRYRGFFSSEIRYTKDKVPYFIDPCCRLGTPSNELLQELFDEWPMVLWHGAEGKVHSPRVKAKYGCLIMLHSEWACNDWQTLYYPKELDQFVKLRYHIRQDDKNCIPPQPVGMPDLGGVVGTGATLLDAIAQACERAEQVQGYQLKVDFESIPKCIDTIEDATKVGIRFTDHVPTLQELAKVTCY